MRLVSLIALVVAMPALAAPPAPPIAEKRPFKVTSPHGATRVDEYYWLRDDSRKDAAMLGYLKAENAYADAMLAPLAPLKKVLADEALSHLKQDDSSVPVADNGFLYWNSFAEGADYPLVYRAPAGKPAEARVLFDEPAMARGEGYFSLSAYEVSPDNKLVGYAEDRIGRRQYKIRFKDIGTGKLLPDVIDNAEPMLAWGDDNRTVLYIEKDPVTLLSKRVKAHVLGTPASADRVVYEESDSSFFIGVGKTMSGQFVCVWSSATTMTEQRCAPATDPTRMTVIVPRQKDVLYGADHAGGRWVIRTNEAAKNYKLMEMADAHFGHGKMGWTELVASSDVFIDGFSLFDDKVAILERAGGNKRLRILGKDGRSQVVAADDAAYDLELGDNRDPKARAIRYEYSSLVTPEQVMEVDAATGERRVLKQQEVPGYDASRYVTERHWVTARDGTRVPVSLVRRKDVALDGKAPLFQYGYGSYGSSSDPAFRAGWLPLLDRGVVIALAHIRGGQEMGRDWYDQGRLKTKMNSFTDFIDITRDLGAKGLIDARRTAAMGRSAGGLLMGGILNMAPEAYKAVVTQVPFVDAVTTMLDASIPLTTNEYDEWGNPERPEDYATILAYSPYDNVAAKAYPATYVSTGLWDSQVQYYEPAKWVARLRDRKTDANPLVFRIDMEAGHGGKSGRLKRYEEQAEWQAFLLDQLGATAKLP